MTSYTLTTELAQPYAAAVEAVRAALTQQGFGILTEIDLKATLKTKLDVDVAPQIAQALQVQQIPLMLVLVDGRPATQPIPGVLQGDELSTLLNQLAQREPIPSNDSPSVAEVEHRPHAAPVAARGPRLLRLASGSDVLDLRRPHYPGERQDGARVDPPG